MNRRSFIKLAAATMMAPYLPVAVPEKVVDRIALNGILQKLFDYTLKNMVLTPICNAEIGSIIKIA